MRAKRFTLHKFGSGEFKMSESQSQRIASLSRSTVIKGGKSNFELCSELREAIMGCFVIPNETENLGELPEILKNFKTKDDNGNHGPTLEQIQRKLDKIANDPIRRKREEKNRRIALYAAMHENNQVLGNEFEFEYCEPDEFWQEPKFAKLAHDIATA